MTNEELDKICCEVAGIEPTSYCVWGKLGIEMPTAPAKWVRDNQARMDEFGWTSEPIFPPVSSDWCWAGKLIDALRAKRMRVFLDFQPDVVEVEVEVHRFREPEAGILGRVEHASAPRALALAVAGLAKKAKKS